VGSSTIPSDVENYPQAKPWREWWAPDEWWKDLQKAKQKRLELQVTITDLATKWIFKKRTLSCTNSGRTKNFLADTVLISTGASAKPGMGWYRKWSIDLNGKRSFSVVQFLWRFFFFHKGQEVAIVWSGRYPLVKKLPTYHICSKVLHDRQGEMRCGASQIMPNQSNKKS